MKLKNIFPLFFICMAIIACENDFLDTLPNDNPTAEGYFESEEAAQQSRIGLYAVNSNLFTDDRYLWDCITDQLFAQYDTGSVTSIYRGVVTPQVGGLVAELYADAYRVIAATNDHIAAIDGMDENLFAEMTKEQYKADARFFKAMYYYYLTEVYGGVPLYTESLPNAEDYEIKQSSKQEVVDYILSELDEAIEVLPNTEYNGYITKSAAQALKARVLLQNKRWQDAADTAEEIIGSGIYSLDPNYFDVFIKKGSANSNEIIFAYEFNAPDVGHSLTRRLTRSAGGTPRQQFVDNYLMADGLALEDSSLDGSNYQNRDPRFYESVYFPEDEWVIWAQNEPTQTGWYIKKYFDPDPEVTTRTVIDQLGQSDQPIIQHRYADVLLVYAEAKHMLGEFDQTVYDATIKLIRDRVGMGNVSVSTMSSDEKLDLIKYERYAELAFEGHSFFDLKRWGMLGETIQSIDDPIGVEIVWDDKFLLWPFTETELNLNPALEQNPGY